MNACCRGLVAIAKEKEPRVPRISHYARATQRNIELILTSGIASSTTTTLPLKMTG